MPDPTEPANAENHISAAFPLGIAFGTATGIILSASTGHWGLWFPVGIGVGTALGLALGGAAASRPATVTEAVRRPAARPR